MAEKEFRMPICLFELKEGEPEKIMQEAKKWEGNGKLLIGAALFLVVFGFLFFRSISLSPLVIIGMSILLIIIRMILKRRSGMLAGGGYIGTLADAGYIEVSASGDKIKIIKGSETIVIDRSKIIAVIQKKSKLIHWPSLYRISLETTEKEIKLYFESSGGRGTTPRAISEYQCQQLAEKIGVPLKKREVWVY